MSASSSSPAWMALLNAVTANIHKPLLIAALAFSTTRGQRILAFFLIVASEFNNFLVILNRPGWKGIADCIAGTTLTASLLVSLDWLVMTPNPRVALRAPPLSNKKTDSAVAATASEKSNTATDDTRSASSLTLKDNLIWATSQAFNVRAIGTPFQVTGLRPLSPKLAKSRRSFCFWRLVSAFCCASSLATSYILVMKSKSLKDLMFTSDLTLLGRVLTLASVVNLVYCVVVGGHSLVSATVVGSGMSEPELWPDIFGSFGDLCSVRTTWGHFWHQTLRRPYHAIGDYLAHDLLHTTPNSTISRLIKLYVAFAITTWNHLPADIYGYSNTFPANTSAFDKVFKVPTNAWFSPQFFMAQPVAITFEMAIIALVKRCFGTKVKTTKKVRVDGVRSMERDSYEYVAPSWVEKVGKVVGHVWVLCWFCWTVPPLCWGILRWEFDKAKTQRQ